MTDDEDARYRAQAVAPSRSRMEVGPGGPFGGVIVRDGAVPAEGWNAVTSAEDSTAHAEATAIYWARSDRLVYANTRERAAAIGFDDAFLYDEVPKPPLDRRMPTRHLPQPEAEATFHARADKTDKVIY